MRHALDVGDFARVFHLSRPQLAAVLGVSARTVRRYRQRGSVPTRTLHMVEVCKAQAAPVTYSVHRGPSSGAGFYEWRERLYGRDWKRWINPEVRAEVEQRAREHARLEAVRQEEIRKRRSASMMRYWRRRRQRPLLLETQMMINVVVEPRVRPLRHPLDALIVVDQMFDVGTDAAIHGASGGEDRHQLENECPEIHYGAPFSRSMMATAPLAAESAAR